MKKGENKTSNTGVFELVREKEWGRIDLLLNKHPECIHEKDGEGANLLMELVWHEQWELIQEILAMPDCDIDHQDNELWNALHYASLEGHLETVTTLVEKGIDINAKSISGKTPLLCACSQNQIEIVQYLIKKGADVSCITEDGHSLYKYMEKNWCNLEPEFVLKNAKNMTEETRKKFMGIRLETLFK